MAAFNDAALSSLTAKIDQKLMEQKSGDKKKQIQSPQTKKDQFKKDQLKKERPKTELKRKRPEEKTDQTSNKREKKDKPPKSQPKAKRQNRGDGDHHAKPSHATPDKSQESDVLLDEIKALGGDEKDLELIGDVDSEDETVGNSNIDKSLEAELFKFASGLGFEKVQPEAVADEDLEEDEAKGGPDGEDDWEEASSDEDALVTQDKEVPAPKGKHKTVSKPLLAARTISPILT